MTQIYAVEVRQTGTAIAYVRASSPASAIALIEKLKGGSMDTVMEVQGWDEETVIGASEVDVEEDGVLPMQEQQDSLDTNMERLGDLDEV